MPDILHNPPGSERAGGIKKVAIVTKRRHPERRADNVLLKKRVTSTHGPDELPGDEGGRGSRTSKDPQ